MFRAAVERRQRKVLTFEAFSDYVVDVDASRAKNQARQAPLWRAYSFWPSLGTFSSRYLVRGRPGTIRTTTEPASGALVGQERQQHQPAGGQDSSGQGQFSANLP